MKVAELPSQPVPDSEEGMVTVEMAVGMTALIAVLAMLVGALTVVRSQAEICQAVREGARAAAMGQPAASAVTYRYPQATDVSVGGGGQWVRVAASAPVELFGQWGFTSVHCEAATLVEPTAGSP